jgi:hypothetical protein
LIGVRWADPLDPPGALEPPETATSARAPTAATNQNRFTDLLLLSWPAYGVILASTNRLVKRGVRANADQSASVVTT